jgi:hypothetical protein
VKEEFRIVRFRQPSLDLIDQCNEIIERYQDMGLKLTLRQLYYQLVSANIVPNTERSYKNVGGTVSDGRLAGLIDWDAIEDRGRQPKPLTEWESPQDIMKAVCSQYRLDRWDGQDVYVELWVEKDALSGVLRPIAHEYHVMLAVNKGYSSQSAMYEAAQRFKKKEQEQEKQCLLLYLGDHDPSGEDMVRDIGDRLEMFGVQNLETLKIALTTKQVKEFRPPPNPAKITDPRAKSYIALHGPTSWEVDALPPQVLVKIIRAAIESVLDEPKMDAVKKREESHKQQLLKAAEGIKD